MRIHADTLTYRDIFDTMAELSTIGLIPEHLHFHIIEQHGSRKRDHAFEVQLGTYTKVKGDKRGWKNSGTHGANSADWGEGVYAATYDEWGYFLAALYHRDENLWCQYHGDRDGFISGTAKDPRGYNHSRQTVFDYMGPTELMHELLTPEVEMTK